MKKNKYPNQGHVVVDHLVDGVSRAYTDGSNLILVVESPTGIESPDEVYKNEVARLVIPMNACGQFLKNIKDAVEALGVPTHEENKSDEKRDAPYNEMPPEDLGAPLPFKQ